MTSPGLNRQAISRLTRYLHLLFPGTTPKQPPHYRDDSKAFFSLNQALQTEIATP